MGNRKAMTTLTVDINNEEEEKAVLAFLNKLKLTYRTNDGTSLFEEQEQEILHREKEFEEGRLKSEPWGEIKKRFARK